MKNKSELSGLFANIAVIILLLCLIVLGLNKIGVYDLPDSVESLLGTGEEKGVVVGYDAAIYESFEFKSNKEAYTKSEITYENAMALIGEVFPRESYNQEIILHHYFGGQEKIERFNVVRSGGLFDITVLSSSGIKVKHITELEDGVRTEAFANDGTVFAAEFDKGEFSVADECGFVLTAEEFLKANPVLDEASFVMRQTEDDVLVDITFESNDFSVSQLYNYTISLEYGIVTDVRCSVGDELVYLMETAFISSKSN